MSVLAIVEHDRGLISPASLGVLTAARNLAKQMNSKFEALTIGADADALSETISKYGAATVHQVHHPMLLDFGPEAWGESIAQVVRKTLPQIVIGSGTERGNEIIAQAAARLDLPAAMNCTEFSSIFDGTGPLRVVRARWGGSLIEESQIEASIKLVTLANHIVEPIEHPESTTMSVVDVDLDSSVIHSFVRDRVERVAGVTLATSPVVVSGGRGVGSAEGFAPLEDLAKLLNGVVGCSRAVTNNGWRNHTDQVGQTGTRIAPDIYIACGISGAIQHWVGAMASKNILAINIDPQANIVTKAAYAVIGDLHEVVPAISAEIKRRRDKL
ncbi:MAG: electron transfer flavoprotein subunit alpha/FixB family protein [Acidimicrobiaceae bacterium]|nr:electron transfer flavoprotein subunit alpha/FixB family protein [Acidimicrobiaceae bacterium]